MFFVLSGFLISYATLRKPPTFRFREYFIDRFARIYAAYLVVLVLVWLIDKYAIYLDRASYSHFGWYDVKTFFGNVAMLQDHPLGARDGAYVITSFGSARPFWTLAIEWWIYMCFGWVVLRGRKHPLLFLPVLAVLAIVPMHNILDGRGNGLALVWIFGSAAYLVATTKLAQARAATLAFGALAFGAVGIQLLRITKEPYDVKFGALLAAMILCTILAIDRVAWKPPAWLGAAIRFIANYSFTLYLLHYSILDLIAHNPVFESGPANFWFAVAVTNVASIAVAYFTELRHRALATWLKQKLC